MREMNERSTSTELTNAPVPSPCISVCRMNPQTGWCDGCHRTIDEIASWSRLTDNQKREVWSDLARRRALKAA